MKIVADENCDRILVAELRQRDNDVVWIRDTAPGISDTEVYEMAATQGRLLLTSDQGFGLMTERTPGRPPGVVLMRLDRLPPAARTTTTVQALATLGEALLRQFTVIEPHQIRSRPYKD